MSQSNPADSIGPRPLENYGNYQKIVIHRLSTFDLREFEWIYNKSLNHSPQSFLCPSEEKSGLQLSVGFINLFVFFIMTGNRGWATRVDNINSTACEKSLPQT